MIAVSPELAEHSTAIIAERKLTFPILRDEGNAYAERLGLRFVIPDELRTIYEGFDIVLPRSNGEDSQSLAIPARYLVDGEGVVRWSSVHPDYTTRPEPEETLAALDGLDGR